MEVKTDHWTYFIGFDHPLFFTNTTIPKLVFLGLGRSRGDQKSPKKGLRKTTLKKHVFFHQKSPKSEPKRTRVSAFFCSIFDVFPTLAPKGVQSGSRGHPGSPNGSKSSQNGTKNGANKVLKCLLTVRSLSSSLARRYTGFPAQYLFIYVCE